MRIGIDVGGTNTDAVLLDGVAVRSWCKMPTTADVSSGIINAISTTLSQADVGTDRLTGITIGTTQFTNAFVERKHLLEVGVIRIALPATRGLPPLVDWPEDIVKAVGTHVHMVEGGYEFDGRINMPLDEQAVTDAAHDFARKGLTAVAISGLFSPLNGAMEQRAAEIVLKIMPNARITQAHTIGRLGLLERENAAIMNASLANLSAHVVSSFRRALKELGIHIPFYISQNDGTLMSADFVEMYPVLTFASGPTNSMRGAAFLSKVRDAIVVDIGGTTSDVGVLTNGYPRESSVTSDIGGVRTNFRMPDVLALGLGGGSIVTLEGELSIGPKSVGYNIRTESLIFGGRILTATDIAVAAGYADIGDRRRLAHLPESRVTDAIALMRTMIEVGVDRMKTSAEPVPLVLVGGGSILVRGDIAGTSDVIIPEYASVANAVGAAIAQVGGEVDRVYSYAKTGREAAIEDARSSAVQAAEDAGARAGTIEIIDLEEIPLAYVPGGAVRLRVKAAGDLAFAGKDGRELEGVASH